MDQLGVGTMHVSYCKFYVSFLSRNEPYHCLDNKPATVSPNRKPSPDHKPSPLPGKKHGQDKKCHLRHGPSASSCNKNVRKHLLSAYNCMPTSSINYSYQLAINYFYIVTLFSQLVATQKVNSYILVTAYSYSQLDLRVINSIYRLLKSSQLSLLQLADQLQLQDYLLSFARVTADEKHRFISQQLKLPKRQNGAHLC